jgi:hypothetical protein
LIYASILNGIYFNLYDDPRISYPWSKQIYSLISYAKNSDSRFVSVDWGIHNQLQAFDHKKGKYFDMWTTFIKDPTDKKTIDFFLKDLGQTEFNKSLNVKIPITFGSKSGKYQYSSLPEKTMLLGFYEKFPISGREKNEKISIKKDDDKRIQYSGNSEEFLPIPSMQRDSFGRKVFSQLDDVSRDVDSSSDFMNVLKTSVYKDDITLNDVFLKNTTILSGESLNLTIPMVARRSELYGPNPLQNLMYADMINWNTNLLEYNIEENVTKWEPRLDYIRNNFRQNIASECQNFILTDILKTGRLSHMQNRYEEPVVVYTEDNGYWITIKDKTRISDVYFGLKEMHIKGYPWKTILNVIDSYIRDSSFRIDYTKNPTSDKPISLYKRSNKRWILVGMYKCSDQQLEDQINRLYTDVIKSFENAWNFMVSSKYINPDIQPTTINPEINFEELTSQITL